MERITVLGRLVEIIRCIMLALHRRPAPTRSHLADSHSPYRPRRRSPVLLSAPILTNSPKSRVVDAQAVARVAGPMADGAKDLAGRREEPSLERVAG